MYPLIKNNIGDTVSNVPMQMSNNELSQNINTNMTNQNVFPL